MSDIMANPFLHRGTQKDICFAQTQCRKQWSVDKQGTVLREDLQGTVWEAEHMDIGLNSFRGGPYNSSKCTAFSLPLKTNLHEDNLGHTLCGYSVNLLKEICFLFPILYLYLWTGNLAVYIWPRSVVSSLLSVCLFSLAMRATDLGPRILPLQWCWISAVIELVLIAATSVAREPLSLSQPVNSGLGQPVWRQQ